MSIAIDSSNTPIKVTEAKKTGIVSDNQEIDSKETVESKVDKFEYSQPQRKGLIASCNYHQVMSCAQTVLQGKQSEDEYKANFKADFYNKLKINLEQGYTTKDKKADILKILDTTYNSYKNGALRASVIESNAERFRKYGSEDRSAVYYSADYYYKGEELKAALKECYMEINEELDLDQADVPKTSQYETYNDVWVQSFRQTKFDAKKAGPPPVGFELYHQPDKFAPSEYRNNYQTYRLIAGNNPTEESCVLYMDVPNGWSLLNKNSSLTDISLESLLSRDNTQEGTISYNITDLIYGYPGKDITARVKAFVVANCINEQAGTLKASCGDWSMETDIPFSTLTETYSCKGSEIMSSYDGDKSNSAAVAFLDNFTFEKYPMYERMKRLGMLV